MGDKKIIVDIDPVGRPKITAQGFTGTSCKDATRALENALSDGNLEVEEAPEMYMGTEQESLYETL